MSQRRDSQYVTTGTNFVNINRKFSDPNFSLSIGNEPSRQDRVRLSADDEMVSYHDSRYQEQHKSSNFDQKATLIDLELKELSELLSAKEAISAGFSVVPENNVLSSSLEQPTQDVHQSQKITVRLNHDKITSSLVSELRDDIDKTALGRESRDQKDTYLQSSDKKAPLLDFDPKERPLLLKENISLNLDHEKTVLLEAELQLSEQIFRRDLEQQEREELFRSDEQTICFIADLQDETPSPSINVTSYRHESEPGSEKENRKSLPDYHSDLENKNTKNQDDPKKYRPGTQITNYNQDVTHKRDPNKETLNEKIFFDEKFIKDVGSGNNDINSDYFSKRRPSLGKTEAEESRTRQRRYSDTQNDIFGETDQRAFVSEERLRQKMEIEGHNDWEKKFDECERERHEKILSIQHKDEELNIWKDKCNTLEKKIDDQVNIKILLDEVIHEKKQLELKLSRKNDELNAEKDRNQTYLEKVLKSELIEEELKKQSQTFDNMQQEKFSLQRQLDETNEKIADLLQSLQQEKFNLRTLSKRIPDLEVKLIEYQKAIDVSLVERDSLQKELKEKTHELSEKLVENDALTEKLKELCFRQNTSDENIVMLQNQKHKIQYLFEQKEKEHDKLLLELDEYKSVLEDLDKIKNDYDRNNTENKDLREQLNMLEKRYVDHINALAADNKQLENMLLEAREEMVRGLESPDRSFYQTVRDQIKALEKENHQNHAEIRELKDQQDGNENLISELKGELLTRDERISILENHINLLQDEIKQLHKNLDDGISASEQLQGQAFEGYENSMKKIEARHSKAFHNIKMELDQLEKEKAVLHEQLSKTKNQNKESLIKNKEYLSRIADLTNERTIILNELKKLEYTTFENSDSFTDNNSDIQSIKESISRISSNLEANRSQSVALESKLHMVKKSSEELLSKTNEAKKIAETEKQKLKLEKEEAVREKTDLEMKMQDLETKFKKQLDGDQATIEDLKKEILNQELLMKEMKESTQKCIQKLNNELETIQDLYKNSQIEISELKRKLKVSHRENDDYLDTINTQNKKLNEIIEHYKEILQKQTEEMAVLQGVNNDLRSKKDADVQTQTEIETKVPSTQSPEELKKISKNRKLKSYIPEKKYKVQGKHRQLPDNISKFAKNITGLQIMIANVQPTINLVKNTYKKHKQGQLSPRLVEQHSILSLVEPTIKKDTDNQILDIYNRRSLDKEQSLYDKTNNIEQSLNTNTNGNIKNYNQNVLSSGQSNDEVFFVIYSSSETVHDEQPPDSSTSNKISRNEENNLTLTNKTDHEKGFDDGTHNIFTDEVREPRKAKSSQRDRKSERGTKVKSSASDECFALQKKNNPNVRLISSIENAGKSSQSSCNGDVSQQILLHSSDTDDDKLKRKETQSKSNLSLNETKPESEDFFDNLSNGQDSHFKLNRVNGESITFKDKNYKITPEPSDKRDLALNFILETAKQETQQTFDYDTNLLRRSQSAESFSKNTSQTGQGNSFAIVKIHQIVNHSAVMPLKEKRVADKGVSINIEHTDNLRKQIKQLTAALYNSEKDYKKKLEAIKAQYGANIKRIINEHNEVVKKLQNLHEDVVKDLVKKHDNEVENLRSISFEAIKRGITMDKENRLIKNILGHNENDIVDQEPIKIDSRFRVCDARLSKTTVESIDIKPRMRHLGPCTCSLDVNVSDTIRNIFDQVDQDQRKLAEFNYVKYIAHKMLSGNVNALDSQELAFLHYNVCRHWKVKQSIEDTLRKKIDSLETELISKQRHAKQHIAELDRQVAEERRRLQEVRDAVGYQPVPGVDMQPDRDSSDVGCIRTTAALPSRNMDAPCSSMRLKKFRPESHCSERRLSSPQQPQNHSDEMPTRLRRFQDRSAKSSRK